jgi:hypothetical protein
VELHLGRVGVPGDVRERLLRNAVDDQLLLVRQHYPRLHAPLDP